MPQPAEDRFLYLIKSRGSQTAGGIAERLGMSAVAARKQLARLEAEGLVTFENVSGSVGRPERLWSLTEKGHARFPDAHSDLTLEVLRSVRATFGEDGLERVIAEREKTTLASYGGALSDHDSLEERVKALTEIRDREGYMAEWQRNDDGSLMLIENHCPICAAATECQGLCRSELMIFRAVLGDGVSVERVDHILAGARRCAYRISADTGSVRHDNP